MKKIFLFTILVIFIPFILIINKELPISLKNKYGIKSNKIIRVKRVNKNKIEEVPLEEYVIGVVSGEMPASFSIEALKAQAVASRSYVLTKTVNNKKDYDVVDTTSNQVYLDDEDKKEKWKTSYDANLKKVTEAVKSTTGEVLIYNNEIVDAMFFSTSNGYTEDSVDVFNSNVPYLKSVSSKWDEIESPAFLSEVSVTKTEFLHNLGIKEDYINIGNINKTNTGRVKTIKINNKNYDASEIRKAFNLKSTSFNIEVNNDKVKFSVKGFGHGVGMSQSGANGMAKESYKYKEILDHYYTNCKLKKLF